MREKVSDSTIGNFSKNSFFKDKHTKKIFFLTLALLISIVGMTVVALLHINNVIGETVEEEVGNAREIVIFLMFIEVVIFGGYIVWVFIDTKKQLDDRVTEVTQHLIKEYKSAYLVDYKNDTFRQIRNTDHHIKKKKHLEFPRFLNEINIYIDQMVYYKDRYYVKDELDYNIITTKLNKNGSYSIIYREFDGNGCFWTEMSFSNYSSDLILVAVARRGTKLLQNKLSEFNEKDYFALFLADIDMKEIRTIKASGFYKEYGEAGAINQYEQALRSFAEKQEGEVKDFFQNFSNVDYVKRELMTENKRTFSYKSSDATGGAWISVTMYVLYRNSDGTPAVFSMGFNKMDSYGSDRQELQLQLKDALSMAESANRAKTIFLSNMSHDIRTPMNAIVGYTGLAANHIENTEQVSDYLGKITQASGHLLSLINDILDMSRIESGKISLEEKHEDLRDIVRSLCDIVAANVESKGISFEKNNVDIIETDIICDKLRLKQALLNVLSNAVKFTPDYGTVSFTVKQLEEIGESAGKYEFRVKDTGIGMSKEFLDTIFDPFTREKSTTKSGVQGSGLGMAITKNIIDMMHGEITIDSTPNKGTEVVITLPFQYAEDGPVKDAPAKEYTKHDFMGTKVLVVEDNPINREITTDILHEYGFIIKCAEDGDIAVDIMKKAKKGDFDAILMDIQMPNMDGYEATRQIRALGTDISKIPIIAMTANAFKEDKIAALESGMNEHLAKPIQIESLLEVLAKFTRK